MSIVINSIINIDETIQLCRVTITYHDKDYEYSLNSPVLFGTELQTWLDIKEQRCLVSILKQMYPDHPNIQTLEEMEQWIADGCIIPETETEPERVAEKVEWTNKHPVESEYFDRKKISIESKQILKDAVTVEDIKEYLKKVHKYHETTIRNNI